MANLADNIWVFQTFNPPRFNNDAGRLLELLTDLRGNPGAGDPVHVAWQLTLFRRRARATIVDEHWVELVTAFAALNELVDELEADLHENVGRHWDLYQPAFPLLRQVLAPKHSQEPLSSFFVAIDQIIPILGHCAKDLPEEGELKADELKKLFDKVLALFEEVQATNISPQLKRWMLNVLGKILTAINQVRSNGTRGLRIALANLIGELAIYGKELAKDDVPEQIKRGFYKVMVDVLDTCAQTTKKFAPLLKLTKWTQELLDGELPDP